MQLHTTFTAGLLDSYYWKADEWTPANHEWQSLAATETEHLQTTALPFVSYNDSPSRPTAKLLTLPTEIQMLVACHLPYPDLLALKLTHPTFHSLIYPTVYDRVDWLLSRPAQGLSIPSSAACSFKTDREFVANDEVKTILRRRGRHLECGGSPVRWHGFPRCIVNGRMCKGAQRRHEKKLRDAERDWGIWRVRWKCFVDVYWMEDLFQSFVEIALVIMVALMVASLLRMGI